MEIIMRERERERERQRQRQTDRKEDSLRGYVIAQIAKTVLDAGNGKT